MSSVNHPDSNTSLRKIIVEKFECTNECDKLTNQLEKCNEDKSSYSENTQKIIKAQYGIYKNIFKQMCADARERRSYRINNDTSRMEDIMEEIKYYQKTCEQLQQCLDVINDAIVNNQGCENTNCSRPKYNFYNIIYRTNNLLLSNVLVRVTHVFIIQTFVLTK